MYLWFFKSTILRYSSKFCLIKLTLSIPRLIVRSLRWNTSGKVSLKSRSDRSAHARYTIRSDITDTGNKLALIKTSVRIHFLFVFWVKRSNFGLASDLVLLTGERWKAKTSRLTSRNWLRCARSWKRRLPMVSNYCGRNVSREELYSGIKGLGRSVKLFTTLCSILALYVAWVLHSVAFSECVKHCVNSICMNMPWSSCV